MAKGRSGSGIWGCGGKQQSRMGFCISLPEIDRDKRKKNDMIEEQLKRDRQAYYSEVKMLLLGAGESGKSTILKQMKLIHEGGYSEREKRAFRAIIYSNIITSLKTILNAMDKLGVPLGSSSCAGHKEFVQGLSEQQGADQLSPQIVNALMILWADQGVQEAFSRNGAEYHLNDSAQYYLDSLSRICSPSYDPSDQDILRSRVKTTGIVETTFQVDKLTYRMFDVGGQRSERKKWIHCFEAVTAIVFLVAISEYDQKLVEDADVNRMQEALTLFDSICNSRWFVKTSIILFLNKIDIFQEKIERVPVEDYFEDYEGGPSYEAACEYFQERFVSLNANEGKQVYTHFTCATDTNQIRFVMEAVHDIIVKKALKDAGLT